MLAPLLVFQYFRLKLRPSLAGIGQVILRKRYTFLVFRAIWQGYRVSRDIFTILKEKYLSVSSDVSRCNLRYILHCLPLVLSEALISLFSHVENPISTNRISTTTAT